MTIIPVILCGGSGSRLWPVSREWYPKPFIKMPDGLSLLQKAFLRGALLQDVTEVLTVTNREIFFSVEEEFREIRQESIQRSYILEPFGRNTTAAIAVAALNLLKTSSKDTLMLILPADHLIMHQDAFQQAVQDASILARQGKLVTFGIKPTEPSTAYGYLEVSGQDVLQFIEKPSLKDARSYVKSRRFLWNSGMFLFTIDAILEEMGSLCPEMLNAVKTCMEASHQSEYNTSIQFELDKATFEQVPNESIDYAVMEKSQRVAVVPCDIGWTDVGSWQTVAKLTEPDSNGNRILGEACLLDVNDCYIQSDNRMVGAIGVDNLLVIDTQDALLIVNRDRAEDVKLVYNRLKQQNHPTYKLHQTVHRPWGLYTILEEGARYKIKRIVVKPQTCLSLQLHHHRSEHWIIVSGMAEVVRGEKTFLLNTNESAYIPAGHKHQLKNPGVIDLVMIEVQTGEFLGEEDIIRFKDQYGRVP